MNDSALRAKTGERDAPVSIGEIATFVVVDEALRQVADRKVIRRDEAIALLTGVGRTLTAKSEAASIADHVIEALNDAALIGSAQIADALLDIRLSLSTTSTTT